MTDLADVLDKNEQHDIMETTAAIERRDRIIQALCCGLDAANNGVRWGSRLNYSSTARAFFDSLQSFVACHGRDDDSIRELIQTQWHCWCMRCEELFLLFFIEVESTLRRIDTPAN
jgi:hypothetical protein